VSLAAVLPQQLSGSESPRTKKEKERKRLKKQRTEEAESGEPGSLKEIVFNSKSKVSASDVEPDNFVSPMTVEAYIEHRLKPIIIMSKKKRPSLAAKLSRFETLVMMLNSLATLLTAIDQKVWVALVVILITVVTNIVQHQFVAQRLSSHNGVVRDLEGLKAWLTSMSIVQRRRQKTKAACVTLTEAAALDTVQAWTGLAPMHIRSGGDDKDEESDKKGQ